jgi:hypothetical protein
MKKLMIAAMGVFAAACAGMAQAKLPPLSEEAKAAAAETKNKAAWSDKIAAYKLCQAQDKVAAYYRKDKHVTNAPTAEVPACSDPGPYVPLQAATSQVGVADSKPVPAAGKPAEAPAPKK